MYVFGGVKLEEREETRTNARKIAWVDGELERKGWRG